MSRTPSPPMATYDDEADVAQQIATREQALDEIGERRRWLRNTLPVSTALRTLAGAEVPARLVDNISEGGLRVTVPVGFGLAVGQRYEVLLRREDSDDETDDVVAEGHYGTVVRTELQLGGDGENDRVGIGLRFDTPIVL